MQAAAKSVGIQSHAGAFNPANNSRLYVLHKLFVCFLYYYTFYLLSLWIPPVRIVYNLFWQVIGSLPLIGLLVAQK